MTNDLTEKKKDDPNQLAAIRIRERACDDRALGDNAVRLFVRILDMSLNPFFNNGTRGRVTIPQDDLGGLIGCSERTIRRSTRELQAANYIWIYLMPKRNTKMQCVYNVTEFVPRQELRQEVSGEGPRVRGRRRYDTGFDRTGTAAGGQQRRAQGGIVDQYGRQIFLNYLEKSAVTGQEQPPSPDKNDRSDRTGMSSLTGQKWPVAADKNVLSDRPKMAGDTGQNCPVGTVGNGRVKESQLSFERQNLKALKNSSETSRVNGAGVKAEKDFLERMGREIGFKAMEKYGGWWTLRFREDPDRSWRVWEDLRSAKKHGEVHTNPGGFAMRLYESFATRKEAVENERTT